MTYNSRLELVLQVVGVSSPVLSFLVLQFTSLHMTLVLDAISFFHRIYLSSFSLPKRDSGTSEKDLQLEKSFF